MQIDLQTTFSGATALDGTKTAQGPITATQLSTNIIDLRSVSGLPSNVVDEGIEGVDVFLNVRTIQAFNNLTSLTITLESDSNSNMATAPVAHYGVTIPLASLGANRDLVRVQLPSADYKRYLAVRYTVTGTAPTTGTVLAAIVGTPQQNTIFPGNFVVA